MSSRRSGNLEIHNNPKLQNSNMEICHAQDVGRVLISRENKLLTLIGAIATICPWAKTILNLRILPLFSHGGSIYEPRMVHGRLGLGLGQALALSWAWAGPSVGALGCGPWVGPRVASWVMQPHQGWITARTAYWH